LFLNGTLELFEQYGIICFSIGLWNSSDSVALFIFPMDFGTVPPVWHHLLFNWTLELFESVALLVFHFSIGLWNCSDSVALFVFLLGFGTVATLCYYLFSYWTLELF